MPEGRLPPLLASALGASMQQVPAQAQVYGKVGSPRLASARSIPYGDALQSQKTALENLLRAVAARAATMETKDIIALTAAFSQQATTSAASGMAVLAEGSADAGYVTVGGQRPGVTYLTQSSVAGHAPGTSVVISNASGYEVPGEMCSLETVGDVGALEASTLLPTLDDVVGALKTVKVSTKANVKSIAGAISNTLRGNEQMVCTAVGPEGLNHAIKALSISRCYLAAEGLDLTSTVTEVQRDEGINTGRCFALTVVRMSVPAKQGPLCSAGVGRTDPLTRYVRPEGMQTDLKVSGQGQAGTLAGAIANCLREDREAVITAIGPLAVAKGVEALALARGYMFSEGFGLFFYPEFQTITMSSNGPGAGETRSSVKLHAWCEIAA